MYIILFALAISFIVFLFFVYIYARDDYFLLRKNATVSTMFDMSFVGLVVSLFSSRLSYVLLHPNAKYLNPLVFFVFWSFPGLTLGGAILGAIVYILYLSKRNKYPASRFYDIFSLSFLPALSMYLLITTGIQSLMHKKMMVPGIVSAVLFLGVYFWVSYFYKRNLWRGGIVFLWSLFLVSLISLGEQVFMMHIASRFFIDNSFMLFLWALSLSLIIREILIGLRKS